MPRPSASTELTVCIIYKLLQTIVQLSIPTGRCGVFGYLCRCRGGHGVVLAWRDNMAHRDGRLGNGPMSPVLAWGIVQSVEVWEIAGVWKAWGLQECGALGDRTSVESWEIVWDIQTRCLKVAIRAGSNQPRRFGQRPRISQSTRASSCPFHAPRGSWSCARPVSGTQRGRSQ